VTDHASKLAARYSQPQILEHRDPAAIGARIAPRDSFDGNEFFRHARWPSRVL
jgi:hypothetical protein